MNAGHTRRRYEQGTLVCAAVPDEGGPTVREARVGGAAEARRTPGSDGHADHLGGEAGRRSHVARAAGLSPAFPARASWGTAGALRAWQAQALEVYRAHDGRDFLAVATPGAGKTTFALRVAAELLAAGTVRRVTVVAPTEHLKRQWADAAHHAGIRLDPTFTNAQGRHAQGFDGVVVTYAQVAARPALHTARTAAAPTLVVLDEIHHAGDALSWGDAVREAFEGAARRLALTGTPFRSDTAAIPFVRYEPDADGVHRSAADVTYGYGQALADRVVRPVIFLTYSGTLSWRTRAGDELTARLGEPATKDVTAQAWRAALDPAGEWIASVLAAADTRLTEVRRAVPDAGGMVIATDQDDARAYAGVLARITGRSPVVVLSDDAGASDKIEEFTTSDDRWLVAVRMVSEGVDVPRLAVGVYATSASTPLFFAQAVGRFVRARRRGETASVFLPSVPGLLALAGSLEVERDHALDRRRRDDDPDALLAEALSDRSGPDEVGPDGLVGRFEALGGQAAFDKVLFDGGEFGTGAQVGSDEELDFLGLPGLLEPEQVSELLRRRQADQVAARRRSDGTGPASPAEHRRVASLRKDLSRLVGAWSRRSGQPHAQVHTELRRRCGGPEVPQATATQIESRITLLQDWFAGKRR